VGERRLPAALRALRLHHVPNTIVEPAQEHRERGRAQRDSRVEDSVKLGEPALAKIAADLLAESRHPPIQCCRPHRYRAQLCVRVVGADLSDRWLEAAVVDRGEEDLGKDELRLVNVSPCDGDGSATTGCIQPGLDIDHHAEGKIQREWHRCSGDTRSADDQCANLDNWERIGTRRELQLK